MKSSHLPIKQLLKRDKAPRPSNRFSAIFSLECQLSPCRSQQKRFAHRQTHHPAKNAAPPSAPENSSASRTYAIWAIAGLFVAIGVSKQLENSRDKKIFDPPRFTPFNIITREEASPTSIILTLRPRNIRTEGDGNDLDPYRAEWERGTWSVEVKQPELQIARRYTPLPPNAETSKTDLRFLVRKEYKGEMSGYLHTLAAGAEVSLRGPHTEYSLPEDISRVVFLAAGTGIAPALQVAHTLLERRNPSEAKIHIVWANRRREDCEGGHSSTTLAKGLTSARSGKIVRELDDLQRKFPNRIFVDYLVDEEGQFLDRKKIAQLVVPNAAATSEEGSRLILISGPDGFVNYFSGPKKWEGGKEGQGALGGVLGQMGLKDWTVWKL